MKMRTLAFALVAAALSQTAGAITATKEYVDRRDTEIRTNTYTKAETDARIDALAARKAAKEVLLGVDWDREGGELVNMEPFDFYGDGAYRARMEGIDGWILVFRHEDGKWGGGIDGNDIGRPIVLFEKQHRDPWEDFGDKFRGEVILTNVYDEAFTFLYDFSGVVYSRDMPTKPGDIGAQPVLTFDTTPTAGSTNPVTSAGIKTALDNKRVTIQIGGGDYTTVNDVIYIPSDYDGSNENPDAVVLKSALVSTTSSLAKSLAPTITNIASTVSSNAIASADTTYRRTIGITNLNQTVQYVSITDTSPITLSIAMPTNGATKDWMVYVTSVTNVSLVLPSATWWMADVAYTNEVPPATPTALWFSQVTDGVFLLGRQELTPVSIEGGN